MADLKPIIRITLAMRSALAKCLDVAGPKPFRRAALAKRLYPLTNPRSLPKADKIADKLIQAAFKAGEIVRHGHLHWVRAEKGRTLRSGRRVAEYADNTDLLLSTHCPGKWVAVDLETGDVWNGSRSGWKRASNEQRAEAASMLQQKTKG